MNLSPIYSGGWLLGQNSDISGSLTKYYNNSIAFYYYSKLLYWTIILPPVIEKNIFVAEWIASNIWLPFRENLATVLGSCTKNILRCDIQIIFTVKFM